jgi:DNA polymerase III sliding clamp (beta) subunit (PCNA family)
MLIATDILKAALFCASSEESRYYLRGVHLSTSGHLVTTDGHRMFVARLNDRPAADVIVPYADVAAALKLAGARCKDIEVTVDVTGSALPQVTGKIHSIAYTPVDGTFPDWRRVVPTGEELPSGKPDDAPGNVHFNHAYVGDLAKMGKLLGGSSMLHPVSASHPCLVTFGEREDCLAVLMPVRRGSGIQGEAGFGSHVKRRVIG